MEMDMSEKHYQDLQGILKKRQTDGYCKQKGAASAGKARLRSRLSGKEKKKKKEI